MHAQAMVGKLDKRARGAEEAAAEAHAALLVKLSAEQEAREALEERCARLESRLQQQVRVRSPQREEGARLSEIASGCASDGF